MRRSILLSLLLLPVVTAADTRPAIDAGRLLAHIRTLASDAFEGRKPGTRGEELTVAYLEREFRAIGLEPGNTDGTFIQRVPLVGITPEVTPLRLRRGASALDLRYKEDFVAWTRRVTDTVSLDASELVFAGYGVEAPEFQWDDFKGTDVAGKTIVVLVNDPPVTAPDGSLDPKVFGGKAMTYYGRWTYKYEKGAEKKAAGVLIVHETEPAGYPWSVVQGFAGERFDLATPDRNMGRAAVEGWITLQKAREIFALAGQDFEALKRKAVSRDFRPVPLGIAASIGVKNTIRSVDSRNVIAKLTGSDPARRDEYVIYTAHWDHLGVGDPVRGDRIYNGAKDNASGTAALLELARAFKTVQPPPKRTILFLAVTAEEQGLLGSLYYTLAPVYPLEKTLAVINIDGLNVHGRTKDITVVGMGASDLDEYLREAARAQGRVLRPDPEPEKGFYYRSDHFNFAKQGVPSLYTDEGVEFIGKPAGYGMQVRDRYTKEGYHAPSDEVKPDWDLTGAVEDVQLFFDVGYRVANATTWPEWTPGNEFRAIRERRLREARIR
ncbi:MAG TPA: M28 family metallopeptidase [Vicinamibacterales bacterium]|nr:M28 family metallopeptidase [Vicinamibacterales bacterium]